MRAPDFTSARWHKSTRSNGSGACVEIAHVPNAVGIRDSKLGQHSPTIALDPAQWITMVEHVKDVAN